MLIKVKTPDARPFESHPGQMRLNLMAERPNMNELGGHMLCAPRPCFSIVPQ